MTVLARARERMLRAKLREHERGYAGIWEPAAIRDWQLERLNALWSDIARHVPRWARLRAAGDLPERFAGWDEFHARVPVMDRTTIREERKDLMDGRRPPFAWRATGGSTAEPVRIPIWREETLQAALDVWLGRSWFGIAAADRLFLIWGHSHLFGRGVRGKASATLRRAKDRALGYLRWSAYDLSDAALERAAEALIRFRPGWVLGYAVALERFARVNQGRGELARLGLKAVVATAESFSSADGPDAVSRVFGCPVAMEYGAVETGPIAHQRPDGRFSVFWQSHLVETVPSPELPGAYEILVTSLQPRGLPLIRYRVGDLVRGEVGEPTLHEMDGVVGRCNDFVTLDGGGVVHSEAFTHVVRDLGCVAGYRVVQNGSEIRIAYTGPRAMTALEEEVLRDRLARIDPRLRKVGIGRERVLPPTVAGKSQSIVRR